MRVLITGITGMIGTALSEHLKDLGYEVSGISRSTSDARYEPRDHYLGDILDTAFVKRVFKDFKPDVVFHLAAQAFNGESWAAEQTTYITNIQGSRNIFEACRDYAPAARVIPACSSAEYGKTEKQPISENTPLKPISPYGVTKACMEMMGQQFADNYDMDFVFPRLFIHVGTGHPPYTAIQNFAKQFAEQRETISVGNVDTGRDYVDIRDGVKALSLLMIDGEAGEVYNVCSGELHSTDFLLFLFEKISGYNPTIISNKNLFRPSDEKSLLGNPQKINRIGWNAEIPIKKTLEWVYNDWRMRLC